MQNSHKLEKCPHVLHSLPVSAKCWTQIWVDIICPLRESNNKKYIVTFVDYFLKYIEAKSLENKTGSAVGEFSMISSVDMVLWTLPLLIKVHVNVMTDNIISNSHPGEI